MDSNKISRDLFKYFNTKLRNELGYDEKYKIIIDESYNQSDKAYDVDIIVASNEDVSTLSNYYINPTLDRHNIVNDLEVELEKYLSKNVHRLDIKSINIDYDYDVIKISFQYFLKL